MAAPATFAESAQAKSADDSKELRQRADLRIDALGSGTDFTGFLDHLGIATLDLGYGGEDEQGIYHSIYDDFYWYTHFSDYDFVYGRALSQTVGTSVMRLADAEVLPFDFVDFADTVQKYTKDLEKLLADKQEEIRERNQELDEGVFKATLDPRRPDGRAAERRSSAAPELRAHAECRRMRSPAAPSITARPGAKAVSAKRKPGRLAARPEPATDRRASAS